MTGATYKRICLGLGLSVDALAKLLGVTPKGLRKRWRSEHIRTEAVLALESLQSRIHARRVDIMMKNEQQEAEPNESLLEGGEQSSAQENSFTS